MNARALGLALAIAVAALPASARDAGTLQVQGAGPYYTVAVPPGLRASAPAAGLEALRVLDAKGQPLPFAWAEPPDAAAEDFEQALPFFKLPPVPRPAASGKTSDAEAGWVIDARGVKGALRALDLALPEAARGVYELALDSSSDLQQWRTLQPSLQIVSLQHQGLRLRSTRIELEGVATGYLRLRVLPGSAVPALAGVQAFSVGRRGTPTPLQWSDPIQPARCDAQQCDYPLPPHMPLEWAQWQLAEPNTLAAVQLLGAFDAAAAARQQAHPHGLRATLKALRRKNQAEEKPASAAAPAITWELLRPATLYRLQLQGTDVRSPPLALDGGEYSRLRLQTSGPISLLGSAPPELRIAARTRLLVFLARGPAPYRLDWQEPPVAGSTALTLAQLMPTRQPGDPLPLDVATVSLPMPAAVAARSSAAPGAAVAPPSAPTSTITSAPTSAPTGRSAWLWAVLVAGLGAMGLMAWSLLRGRPST